MTGSSGVSSTPQLCGSITGASEYLYGSWSRIVVVDHVGHLLVRRRTTSPRPDLEAAGRVGGARVKGGRRPSRSDVALDDREPRGRLEGRVSVLVLATLRRLPRRVRLGRDIASQTCIRLIHPDQNHDACMRIGGEAPRRRVHSGSRREGHVFVRITATSDVVSRPQGGLPKGVELRKLRGHAPAGRNLMPSVNSPVVTSRHSAMRSLRASATIMVLRVVLRPSAVRSRNQWASLLCLCQIRKRQANWIIPRRTRPLPARASPFSRRR